MIDQPLYPIPRRFTWILKSVVSVLRFIRLPTVYGLFKFGVSPSIKTFIVYPETRAKYWVRDRDQDVHGLLPLRLGPQHVTRPSSSPTGRPGRPGYLEPLRRTTTDSGTLLRLHPLLSSSSGIVVLVCAPREQ